MKCLIDMDEEWRSVAGQEGKYEVSNLGKVRSLDRYETVAGRHPTPYQRKRKGRGLRQTGAAYLQVNLPTENGMYPHLVHRLVATAFCLRPRHPDYNEVHHKDEDKYNNRADNLEWTTSSLNSRASCYKTTGSKCGTSKLNESQVLEIVRLLKDGMRQTEVASRFGVTNHTIHKIKVGKNWGWLTGLGQGG